MKKMILNKSLILWLVSASFTNFVFAQQTETLNKDLKVTIIKKTIDGNSSETVEKIEQLPAAEPFQSKADKITEEDKAAMGVIISETEQGVRIDAVQGAAKEAGLLEGDIIFSFEGVEIKSVAQLQKSVQEYKIGDLVNVEFFRSEKKMSKKLTLRSADRTVYLTEKRVDSRPRLHKQTKHDPCQKLESLRAEAFIGVYVNTEVGTSVTDIIENSAAADSKLKIGDVISKINDNPINDYDNLKSVLKQYKPGQIVKIGFERNGKTEKTRVRLGSLADRDPHYTKKLEECCNSKPKNTGKEADLKNEAAEQIIIELYPNPATQIINLNFNAGSNDPINISISNLEGKEILNLELNSNQGQYSEQINIEKLPKGIYLLTIKQGNTILSRQFSKI